MAFELDNTAKQILYRAWLAELHAEVLRLSVQFGPEVSPRVTESLARAAVEVRLAWSVQTAALLPKK